MPILYALCETWVFLMISRQRSLASGSFAMSRGVLVRAPGLCNSGKWHVAHPGHHVVKSIVNAVRDLMQIVIAMKCLMRLRRRELYNDGTDPSGH